VTTNFCIYKHDWNWARK